MLPLATSTLLVSKHSRINILVQLAMAPSRRALSTAIIVVVVFLVTATEMAPSVEAARCYRLSGNFKGACFDDRHCKRVCLGEGNGYNGGVCGTNELKCYCVYDCARSKVMAPAPGGSDSSSQ